MKLGYFRCAGDGGGLARKLLPSEGGLTVWDADGGSSATLQSEGAQVASSGAGLARACDVILICPAGGADLRKLVLGADGLGDGLAPGKTLIVASDGDPGEISEVAEQLAGRGVAVVGAVLRSVATGPNAGESMLLVSGPEHGLAAAVSALMAISQYVVRCGERTGDAQAVALIDRTMTIASGFGTLEAVAAGRKMGLTLRSMIEVLNKGSGRNYMTGSVLPAVAEGKTALAVPIAEMLADIDRAVSLGVACGAPTPIASAARSLLQQAGNTLEDAAVFDDVAGVIELRAKTRLVEEGQGTAPQTAAGSAEQAGQLAIGYIGLGAMGGPLARRLMQSYKTQVFDTRAEAVRALAMEGATAAADLASLARACDVIMVCVPTSAVVREVLFGKGGVGEGLAPGKIVVDQTTGDPLEARALEAELQRLGVSFVDAPVTGGPETAQAGTATMICGGPEEAYARVLPVLKAIGPNVIYCGPTGSGHAAKLVNNASNISNRLIAYEAALLGFKHGLALSVLDEAVNKSTGWSFASQRMFKAVASHTQTASISLELSLKDIWSAVRMGSGCGAPMVVADTVRNLFQIGVNRFGGDANVDEMARLFEQMGGTTFTAG